jgi:hypothetical protein
MLPLLPPARHDDAAWDLPEPDVSPIPEDIAEATFDVDSVLASWRDVEMLEGPLCSYVS